LSRRQKESNRPKMYFSLPGHHSLTSAPPIYCTKYNALPHSLITKPD
jgi:hypothetical protein